MQTPRVWSTGAGDPTEHAGNPAAGDEPVLTGPMTLVVTPIALLEKKSTSEALDAWMVRPIALISPKVIVASGERLIASIRRLVSARRASGARAPVGSGSSTSANRLPSSRGSGCRAAAG